LLRIGSSEKSATFRADADGERTKKSSLLQILPFAGLVAFSAVIRPDPIPNSAVKHCSADGTMSQDLGE
jgi:hypothetical protein